VSAAAPASPANPADGLGLSAATALVVGSIVGVGIFNLPTSLAAFGPISLISMGLTTIGAIALAMLFAALSRRMPADGGPYAVGAVGGGMAVTLFSYLGVETASVAAAKVRDPSGNVPRATILGTLARAVVYVLALVAVLGILPARKLADANAPFSSAVNAMFGGTLWAT
jgi:basic amino acid/polyamine antiporter, APA family